MSGYDVTYKVKQWCDRWVVERNGRLVASCEKQDCAIRFAAMAAISTQSHGVNATFRVDSEYEAKPLSQTLTGIRPVQPGL